MAFSWTSKNTTFSWHLVSILAPFSRRFDPRRCLGEPLVPPWGHLCLQTSKSMPAITFLGLILEGILNTHFSCLFFISFSSEFFKGLRTTLSWFKAHFNLNFVGIFTTFWKCWKPWKTKPLPRENTIWEFLKAHIFIILGTCFAVSSRILILSIFYRILSVLGLHLVT